MSIKREYNFDQVGDKDMYLLHHEEIESLAKNIPEAKRIRFFMTFGQSYLDHMRCLEDVGMLSTTPVNFNGQEIVPIQFLRTPPALAPAPRARPTSAASSPAKRTARKRPTTSTTSATIRSATRRSALRPSATPPAYRPCAAH